MTASTQECAAISHPDLFILLTDHLAWGSLVSMRCTQVSMNTAVCTMERWKEGQLSQWLMRLDNGAGHLRRKYFKRIIKMFGTDLKSVVEKLNEGQPAKGKGKVLAPLYTALNVPDSDKVNFWRGRHWPLRVPLPWHFWECPEETLPN